MALYLGAIQHISRFLIYTHIFCSHGTRCAGEVSAARDNGICGVGVAYDSKVAGLFFFRFLYSTFLIFIICMYIQMKGFIPICYKC